MKCCYCCQETHPKKVVRARATRGCAPEKCSILFLLSVRARKERAERQRGGFFSRDSCGPKLHRGQVAFALAPLTAVKVRHFKVHFKVLAYIAYARLNFDVF